MKHINRRDFVKQAAQITSGIALTGIVACDGEQGRNAGFTVMIPKPIQIVIDDVGWWSGEDGSSRQEPYRSGIGRKHVPADYQAIVDLGKKLDIRPQAASILCEWDRENILRQLPTSTWMGTEWDNSRWVGPWLEEAADIIRNNRQHYELTLHGVGHEYWIEGSFSRAEWADKAGKMRPLDQVELHLDFFDRLLDQNQLGPFPTSFVPTAFCHTFGPSEGHNISMAEVIKKRGIRYINTPFYDMHHAEAAQYGVFGIDAGVMTVDRGEDLFDWDVVGGKPLTKIKGPTCGLHWPNLLHRDPERNSEVVDTWVKYLAPYDAALETLLAPDSTAFQQQLAHHICTITAIDKQYIYFDFNKIMTVPDQIAGLEFVLKLKSVESLRFTGENIAIHSESFVKEQDAYLYTLRLRRIPQKKTARIETDKVI